MAWCILGGSAIVDLGAASTAWAAAGDAHPRPGPVLFGLAVLVVAAKLGGLVAERWGQPSVLGEILLDPYGGSVRTRAEEATLSELLRPLASLFVPLFFVVMGIQVHLRSLADPSALGLSVLLVACAIAGKLACGLGVVRPHVSRLVVGIAIIFAGIGANLTLHGQPILAQSAFAAIVVMVVLPTLVTPIGLQWAFSPTRQAKRMPR